MACRLYHKGTLTAEAGGIFLAMAVGLSYLPITDDWGALTFLMLGLLLIMFGACWEMTAHIRHVSGSDLTHLHWLARFCPCAAELLKREPIPVWRDALFVDAECRKRGRDDDAPQH